MALAKPADGPGGAAHLAAQRDDEIERLARPQSLDPRWIAALEPDDVAVPRRGDVGSGGGAMEDVLDAAGVPAHVVGGGLQTGEVRQCANQRDAERGRAAEPAGGRNRRADFDRQRRRIEAELASGDDERFLELGIAGRTAERSSRRTRTSSRRPIAAAIAGSPKTTLCSPRRMTFPGEDPKPLSLMR